MQFQHRRYTRKNQGTEGRRRGDKRDQHGDIHADAGA